MTHRRFAIFQGDRILLKGGRLPDEAPTGVVRPPLGALETAPPDSNQALTVLEWPESEVLPTGYEAHPLRVAFSILGDDLGHVGRAAHLLRWRRTDRFCGQCGSANALSPDGRSSHCPSCDQLRFPQLAPAMIVLIHDGDRVLLGRGAHYPPGMYSTLAGFVEVGESLEECVQREVLEEAGVQVTDITYQGSQHWPFPHSLMVGFHARWVSGEARCADDELEDVAWFSVGEMPRIPPRESIAHHLITSWIASRVGGE